MWQAPMEAALARLQGVWFLTCRVSSEGSRREWTSVTAAMCITCVYRANFYLQVGACFMIQQKHTAYSGKQHLSVCYEINAFQGMLAIQ